MIRYKTRTAVTEWGESVFRLIVERGAEGLETRVPEDTGPVAVREVVLEPVVYIHVADCRATLGAMFEDGRGSVQVTFPEGLLPDGVWEAIHRDVAKQGSITWSGCYPILSGRVRRFVRSRRFREWLAEQARGLGLEVVEEG